MATPREILRRAESRKSVQARPQPMPAPAPMQMKPVQPAPVQPTPMAAAPAQPAPPPLSPAERVVVPQPIRSNSVYHQLMASHDRMHTRHLKG